MEEDTPKGKLLAAKTDRSKFMQMHISQRIKLISGSMVAHDTVDFMPVGPGSFRIEAEGDPEVVLVDCFGKT